MSKDANSANASTDTRSQWAPPLEFPVSKGFQGHFCNAVSPGVLTADGRSTELYNHTKATWLPVIVVSGWRRRTGL